MSSKYTEKAIKLWLKDFYPRYKLLSWASTAGSKSTFLDTERNVTFNCVFYNLKSRLLRDSNHLFAPTKDEVNKKREQTSVQKYGVSHALKLKSFQNKQQLTNLLKRGVRFPAQCEKVKQKTIKTNIKKYGESVASKTCEVKKKTAETNREKYGYSSATKNPAVKKKTISTLRKKFKNEQIVNISQCPGIQEKVRKTRIAKKQIRLIDGKSLREIAAQKGCGYTTLTQKYNMFGPAFVAKYEVAQTQIEQQIRYLLEELDVSFIQNKKLKSIKPDFYIPAKKLVIECDGLYWHSDAKLETPHHLKRKKIYNELKLTSLFFREDEIAHKFPIVKSIIKNKVGLSRRIFAHRCSLDTTKTNHDFFHENHLMGKGQGRIYVLKYQNEIICAIQVKWKSKKNKILEISRFAPKIDCLVFGGFSKLVSHVVKVEQPQKIITFIDLRYGSGTNLPKLGWKHTSTNLSFKWCKNRETAHRLTFPRNTGYQNGYQKIWDCGQARYELEITNL